MSQLFQDDGQPANGQKKVCIATTVYQDPAAAYTFSIQKSREYLHRNGIQTAYMLLSGNCHVDDARNSIVQEFLLTDCTDLVFLDADVCWEPEELLKLCRFDVDIVGGVYPYRSVTEESKANMPVIMYPGVVEPDDQGLIEVAGLPTGFMKVKREVLEKLSETAHKHWKRNDRRSMVPILFERTFLPENGLIGGRLGGDLSFCKKWVDAGGKCYAAVDLHLGHVVKSVVYDSLGAALRRQGKETLKYMADRVREGDYNPTLFSEARRALGNKWGALEDVLAMCAILGKKADAPIIEAGSGLTSIVLAAASNQHVWALEHDALWASETERMAKEAGVKNLTVVRCDIKDGWYDVPAGLPDKFSLGLNDGPPRSIGSRMGFFKHFGDVDTVICDDADDAGYGEALKQWSHENGRSIDFLERSALIRKT